MSYSNNKLRIGILSHDYLTNIGSNDLLKSFIKGLIVNENIELIFFHPKASISSGKFLPKYIKDFIKKFPFMVNFIRSIIGVLAVNSNNIKRNPLTYYNESIENMLFVPMDIESELMNEVAQRYNIDLFMPSMRVFNSEIKYINYWYDCQHKYYPQFFSDDEKSLRDKRIIDLLGSGKSLIVNSLDAKKDLVKFYGANQDQIFELPFAPFVNYNKLLSEPSLIRHYNLPKLYFAICNQFWIHKSLETVIEAARISKKLDLKVHYVFTGTMEEPRKPGYIEGLLRMVDEYDLKDYITFLGFISKEEQLEVIRGAVAVIQPTLFEGGPGGGSVYDAHCLGVRSIVSDIPINQELPIDNNRIFMFKAGDADDLVQKILTTLDQNFEPLPVDFLVEQSEKYKRIYSNRLFEVINHELSKSQ